MSVYLTSGEDEPAFVASNTGWAEVAAWVGRRSDEMPELAHLCDHGWVEPAGKLSHELDGVIADDPNVQSVLEELAALVMELSGTAAVCVTDGSHRGA